MWCERGHAGTIAPHKRRAESSCLIRRVYGESLFKRLPAFAGANAPVNAEPSFAVQLYLFSFATE